jgi:hypothetical protein
MTAARSGSSVKMALEQWVALDEDVSGEIVDGTLVEEETASFVHEVVVAWLITLLGTWAAKRGAIVAGSDVKLGVSGTHGERPTSSSTSLRAASSHADS